jgi:hypothetical protein
LEARTRFSVRQPLLDAAPQCERPRLTQSFHALFNAFRELVDHFRNKAVVTDPAKLRKLIKATDDYLGERELLRPLRKLGGEMSGRVNAGKLDPLSRSIDTDT